MWELNCPSFKRGQEDHNSADACDTTSAGMPARRFQGDIYHGSMKRTLFIVILFELVIYTTAVYIRYFSSLCTPQLSTNQNGFYISLVLAPFRCTSCMESIDIVLFKDFLLYFVIFSIILHINCYYKPSASERKF